MKTIKIETEIRPDGSLKIDVPSGLPPGSVEVLVVLQPRNARSTSNARKWGDLEGLGKEIWQGVDAQTYVNRLREEWE